VSRGHAIAVRRLQVRLLVQQNARGWQVTVIESQL